MEWIFWTVIAAILLGCVLAIVHGVLDLLGSRRQRRAGPQPQGAREIQIAEANWQLGYAVGWNEALTQAEATSLPSFRATVPSEATPPGKPGSSP